MSEEAMSIGTLETLFHCSSHFDRFVLKLARPAGSLVHDFVVMRIAHCISIGYKVPTLASYSE
jgi:hypothetical protein